MRQVELKRKKWVQPSEGVRGHWAEDEIVTATFHQFGTAYEEFEAGPGNYSVAIVELPDGTVENAHLNEIRFID
ncbi:hypothetical protein HUW52_27500 [Pseudomonas sp. 43A]|uniref:hypothetical protein n=1 Tax=unclassified Pseudomonas TaxID=196821 RepID=UPI00158790DF|nr:MULTISPECIES: hypothetical protein [unclassified Pseudomonas]QKV66503.1 hypothetical protein HUW52_27500 [Pseudomonas sp. 43A]QMW11044.1 hypothetical protein H3303_05205 [Pseudomonas sp. 29A]